MQRYMIVLLLLLVLGLLAGLAIRNPTIRTEVKVLLGLEAPPQITPLALVLPSLAPATATGTPSPPPSASPVPPTATIEPSTTPTVTTEPSPTPVPTPSATPAPVVINGRVYDAYIPAAVKEGQRYAYTCEFDAAWVILQTFGVDVSVDAIIERAAIDSSIEPYFVESSDGVVIYGGNVLSAFSGNYRENFLARSTGSAFVPVFESYGLHATPVRDRAAVEAALRSGALIWMKTTVDFKPWRPATWITPQGERIPTVLGNDHAVVAIGFNSEVVVIRDVLGPTSSNWRRPLEYEVDWQTFLNAWGAQNFDGLAVSR